MRKKNAEKKGPRSYDLLGNIAVVNADPATAKKMAKEIMSAHKHVETVLRRGGAVSGRFRTRKHLYVAGRKNYLAEYKENGCTFRFDVRKSFFSSRLAFERQRITSLVNDKETVVVMFAGVGPFAIEIAKAHKGAKVIAMELNKHAVEEMKKNILLNKTANVQAEYGDVHKLAAKFMNTADRILMPLPMSSSSFLGDAMKVAKKKCVIHYYAFVDAETGPEGSKRSVGEMLRRNKAKAKFLGCRVVRTYSASEVEIVLDTEIRK